MKSAEYWKRAALLREVAVQEGATATAKDVLKLYDEALDDINTEIQKIKYNFQKRFGLDDKTAAMFLTEAQREENLTSLIYALENAPDEESRQAILKYIQRDGSATFCGILTITLVPTFSSLSLWIKPPMDWTRP